MIPHKNIVLAATASLVILIFVEIYGTTTTMHPAEREMHHAVDLSEHWMCIVDSVVQARNLPIEKNSSAPHYGIIGIEYSSITTTLGVLESKELTANPNFAALMVRYLVDAGIDSSQTVGVTMSGSFPGLAVSTIAALQTLHIKGVLISSIGASSQGANRPELTWIDMENILRSKGMNYHSSLVTLGAEGDSGAGLFENGKELLIAAAQRNDISIFIPSTFQEAIDRRLQLFRNANISMLINIGGSHAILGNCPHGESIPNGFHTTLFSCYDDERGVLMRISEHGIPVIHVLNIRSLAERFGISSYSVKQTGIVFENVRYNKFIISCSLVMILAGVFAAKSRNKNM